MNVEEQVREALQRAGHERHVDVHALHDSTRQVLLHRGRELKRAPQRWRPIALGAAAAVVAIGGVVALPNVDLPGLPDLGPAPSGFPDGGVDDDFTCPMQAKSRFDPDQDDSFLPELTDGLRPAGEAAGAPRWETAPTAEGAVLRLGNEDGTLASITRFEKSGGTLRPVLIAKCINGSSSRAALVQDGLPAEGPNALIESMFAPGSQRIVDRLTYDVRGLETRRPVWAEPCGRSVCLKSGTTDAFVSGRLTPDVPEDATGFLADPDDMVGQDLGVRLVVVHDRDSSLESVDWVSDIGRSHSVPALRGGWQGQLFVFIAPDSDLAQLHLHRKTGESQSLHPDEFLE